MQRVEVRCCCDAGKLLGWIELPEHCLYAGNALTFPINGQRTVHLELAKVSIPPPFDVVLSLASSDEIMPTSHLAIKNHDLPIEVLRQIPGFEENA